MVCRNRRDLHLRTDEAGGDGELTAVSGGERGRRNRPGRGARDTNLAAWRLVPRRLFRPKLLAGFCRHPSVPQVLRNELHITTPKCLGRRHLSRAGECPRAISPAQNSVSVGSWGAKSSVDLVKCCTWSTTRRSGAQRERRREQGRQAAAQDERRSGAAPAAGRRGLAAPRVELRGAGACSLGSWR